MISLPQYTPIYYNTLLLIVLLSVPYCLAIGSSEMSGSFGRVAFWPLVIFVAFYMGLRPISGYYFGDMGTYASYFKAVQYSLIPPDWGKGEWVFDLYIYLSSQFVGVKFWFLLTATLYVGIAALAFRKVHKERAYLALLFCIASFSFWSYGTNGIRNGLATSLVLLGIACSERKWLMITLFIAAFGIHHSTMLPIATFLLTLFYKHPRHYLYGYGLAILLSLTMGSWWESFFASFQIFNDDRFAAYLTTAADVDSFSSIGFRFDFLFYSLLPIGLGAYYIFKKKYQDLFYFRLFNTYVAANAFWILVIRANYSNRFAYLSWFMMSWVIIYPLLKQRLFALQNQLIVVLLIGYFAFTYLMNFRF